jgi:hypothetical protein
MTERRRKSQRQQFIEAAREAGADERPEAFERIFTALVPPKKEGDVASKGDAKPRSKDRR